MHFENNPEIYQLVAELDTPLNAKNGGALYFTNSAGKISNSELNNNKAQSFGGAIFFE